eukprot:PhF_6_TR1449/c0_g1_i1/m.2577
MLFPEWITVLLPTIALVFSNFFFSSGQILSSMALQYVSVLVVLTVRTGFATVVMIPTCFLSRSFPTVIPTTRQMIYLALLGVLGHVMTFTLWLAGISLTSVSTAGIIAVLQPVISLAISLLLKTERYARYQGVSMALGMLGNTIMIVVHGTVESNSGKGNGLTYILGCLALISSCVSYT